MRNELEGGFFFWFLLCVCPGTEGESPALGMQEEINLPAVKPAVLTDRSNSTPDPEAHTERERPASQAARSCEIKQETLK